MNLRKAFVVSKASGNFAGVALQTIKGVPATIPPSHVKVQMKAARINPVDMDLAGGLPFAKKLSSFDEDSGIMGVDGSGTITQLGSGSGTDGLKVGDKVFVYRPFTDFGTWAEEVCVPARCVAKVPSTLSLQDAGAVSLTAATAYDSLFRQLRIGTTNNKTILVLGAGGGVGFAAVRFAVHAGMRVVAYAGARDFDKLKAAGVARVIDYKAQELGEVLSPGEVEYVFDAAGKSSLSQLMTDLKPSKVCTSVKHPNPMEGVGVSLGFFWKSLFWLLAYKDNRTARKENVELIGQVTPAGHASLLSDVAARIDDMDSFQVSYKAIPLSEIESYGGKLSEKDLGKVIVFDE